jgi:hypothetical protein
MPSNGGLHNAENIPLFFLATHHVLLEKKNDEANGYATPQL